MLNIAICEDNPVHAEKLCQMIKECHTGPFEISLFSSSNEFIASCNHSQCPFFLIFMDIELGNASDSGISLAQKINLMNSEAQIIFISQYLEYAPSVYETKHVYFINKDHLEIYFKKALTAALRNLHSVEKQYLYFKKRQKLYQLTQREVLYMERILRKTEIHTSSELYSTSERLPVLMEQLSTDFVLCHRSFVVNLRAVNTIGREELTFLSGKSIPIGRTYYPNVKKAFAQMIVDNS